MLRSTSIGFVTVVAVLLSMSLQPSLRAGTIHLGQQSLKGLEGLNVGVKQLTRETQDFGLTRDMIRQDVESIVNKAGIKLLSVKEALFLTPGSPSLGVEVTLSERSCVTEGSPLAYTIDLRLAQNVTLARDKELSLPVYTWRAWDCGEAENLEDLRSKIKEKAEEFVQSYKAANSSKQPSFQMKPSQGEVPTPKILEMEELKKKK